MQKNLTRLSVWLSAIYFMSMRAIADTTNSNNSVSGGLSSQPGIDLTVQSLYGILQGLACYASDVILVAMVLAIIWYGFQMMIAQGNDTKFSAARKSLTYAVVGIAVILGTYTIIATVGNAVTGLGTTKTVWSYTPLSCSIYSLH